MEPQEPADPWAAVEPWEAEFRYLEERVSVATWNALNRWVRLVGRLWALARDPEALVRGVVVYNARVSVGARPARRGEYAADVLVSAAVDPAGLLLARGEEERLLRREEAASRGPQARGPRAPPGQ